MMPNNEAGFSQQSVEGEILNSVPHVPSHENRKSAIAQDRHAPKISDGCLIASRIERRGLSVYGRGEGILPESYSRLRRKRPLREDLNPVVIKPCSFQKSIHPSLCGLELSVEPDRRAGRHFFTAMIATMHAYGKELGLLPDGSDCALICAPPVPWDERDGCRDSF